MSFQQYLSGLQNKSVAVVGMGISNIPLIEALISAGVETKVYDKRTEAQLGDKARMYKQRGVVLYTGDNYLEHLQADVVFRTPGIMPTNPSIVRAVNNGAILTSEMEVFFDVCPCRIIGITGSNGKTTTTSIIAELLRNAGRNVHIGGNIGRPLLCNADEMNVNDIAVLELSSFQLVSMKKSPQTAVMTNLSPNHLDVHKDMDDYFLAKSNIFTHQSDRDTVIFNLDNGYTDEYVKSVKTENVLYFSSKGVMQNGVRRSGDSIYFVCGGKDEYLMSVKDVLLPGDHNIENFMAAFLAVRNYVSFEVMVETAKSFGGVRHRLEFIREHRGIKYFNDSIATNPVRTIAGLKSFKEKVILIAGGKERGHAYDELSTELLTQVKALILFGENANSICDAVQSTITRGQQLDIVMCDSMKDAVTSASDIASSGDIVLFSPASASYDMFNNFEERGECFRRTVLELL